MKANFTIDEMVFNSIVSGAKIWHDGQKCTVLFCKVKKLTRQIYWTVLDENDEEMTFISDQDDDLTWEVNNTLDLKTANVKRYLKEVIN